MRLLLILLEIVIGLALVGTIATSTSSGSTALAGFASAQALVIIIPLIFVAIILFSAVAWFRSSGKRTSIGLYLNRLTIRLAIAFVQLVQRFQFARLASVK